MVEVAAGGIHTTAVIPVEGAVDEVGIGIQVRAGISGGFRYEAALEGQTVEEAYPASE